MWAVFFLLFLLLPSLLLSLHSEDLGELSANPARLSGLSGLFGFSGGFADPANKIDGQTRKTRQTKLTSFISPCGAGNPYRSSSATNPYGLSLRIEGR